MKKFFQGILKLFPLMLIGLMLFSCVPQRKVRYMQDIEGAPTTSTFVNPKTEYKVQPGDYLYVRIFTMDKDANEIFSDMSGVSSYNNLTDQNIYLNSYYVDDSGFISVPLLGKITAGGMLLQEIEKEIYDLILQDVNNPGVIVRQVNFKITVLGEVKNPGMFPVYQRNISLFEALAFAGDLTTYSNRNAAKLIRRTGNKTDVYTVDLTRKDLLGSENFYMRPGDILYIEPLRYKQYAFESFPYALVLSSLSTVLALLTFFRI